MRVAAGSEFGVLVLDLDLEARFDAGKDVKTGLGRYTGCRELTCQEDTRGRWLGRHLWHQRRRCPMAGGTLTSHLPSNSRA